MVLPLESPFALSRHDVCGNRTVSATLRSATEVGAVSSGARDRRFAVPLPVKGSVLVRTLMVVFEIPSLSKLENTVVSEVSLDDPR